MRRTLAMAAAILAIVAVPATGQMVCADPEFRVAFADGLSPTSRYRVTTPAGRNARNAVDTGFNDALAWLNQNPGTADSARVAFDVAVYCAAWVSVASGADSATIAALTDSIATLQAVIDSLVAGGGTTPPDSTPPVPLSLNVLPDNVAVVADSAGQDVWAVLTFEDDARPYVCPSLDEDWAEALVMSNDVQVRLNGATAPGPCWIEWEIPTCADPAEQELHLSHGGIVACGDPPMRGSSFATFVGIGLPDDGGGGTPDGCTATSCTYTVDWTASEPWEIVTVRGGMRESYPNVSPPYAVTLPRGASDVSVTIGIERWTAEPGTAGATFAGSETLMTVTIPGTGGQP